MKDQMLATLENAKEYTLAVAAAMPDEHYAFKVADEVFTFNELLHHIGYGIYWWEENYIRQKETEWTPPAVTTGKKATVRYLTDAFRSLKKSVEALPENDKAIHGFYATIDHITHHRGQATTYLRYKGITPPAYVF